MPSTSSLDAGNCGLEPSTIVDLSGDAPKLLRAGKAIRASVSMTLARAAHIV